MFEKMIESLGNVSDGDELVLKLQNLFTEFVNEISNLHAEIENLKNPKSKSFFEFGKKENSKD